MNEIQNKKEHLVNMKILCVMADGDDTPDEDDEKIKEKHVLMYI